MLDPEVVRRIFCQKCGDEGHHARDCSKSLWCVICRKETHVTAKCVWPKQSKPIMPIVGMVVDGLGFYSSQFAKNVTKKPKKNILGLVKILEGSVSADDLEADFGFHFPWGRVWKATKGPRGYVMQFPSIERLEELTNFSELKMKISGVKIAVEPWNSQATAKAKLHSAWIRADNVPEEIMNYQAICELGSTIGAVEEIDLEALETKDIVRFKVNVKSISMIPSMVEIGSKPYLYDIFFKVETVDEEGWNDESFCLGKRATVENLEPEGITAGNSTKKAKNDKGKGIAVPCCSAMFDEHSSKSEKSSVHQKENPEVEKKADVDSEEKVDYDGSEDDLLDSQELDELVKEANLEMTYSQEITNAATLVHVPFEDRDVTKDKKGKGKALDLPAGTRNSSRLEANDDTKVTDKAIFKAEAKDAFLHKERDGKKKKQVAGSLRIKKLASDVFSRDLGWAPLDRRIG